MVGSRTMWALHWNSKDVANEASSFEKCSNDWIDVTIDLLIDELN